MAGSIVLLSGGLDSTVVLYHLRKLYPDERIVAMFFNYGQKSTTLESKMSQYHARKCGAEYVELNIDLDFTHNRMLKKFSEDASATDELPMRNLVFLAHAVSYAKIHDLSTVALGLLITRPEEGDLVFEDTTEDFAVFTDAYLRTIGLNLYTPLIQMAKIDVLQYALDLHIPLETVNSCNHANGMTACGECADCKLWETTIAKLNDRSNPENK